MDAISAPVTICRCLPGLTADPACSPAPAYSSTTSSTSAPYSSESDAISLAKDSLSARNALAPFFTTYLIRTIAWKTILADASPIVDVLQVLAIIPDDGRVLATSGAVIAGLTYNFLPFMILPIYASLERIDKRMLEAAYDLYATRREVIRRVVIPLSAPGIVAAGADSGPDDIIRTTTANPTSMTRPIEAIAFAASHPCSFSPRTR